MSFYLKINFKSRKMEVGVSALIFLNLVCNFGAFHFFLFSLLSSPLPLPFSFPLSVPLLPFPPPPPLLSPPLPPSFGALHTSQVIRELY